MNPYYVLGFGIAFVCVLLAAMAIALVHNADAPVGVRRGRRKRARADEAQHHV